MSETKHIVNRVAVNTLGIATENAFKWRAEVAAYLSGDFPRQLQIILDEFYNPDEQVRIDRLELSIDLVKGGGTELFQRELIQSLRRALTNQKREATLMNFQEAAAAAGPAISNRSLDAWFFYLQKGYYPWFHQQVLGAKEVELLVLEHAKAIAHQLPVILESLQAQQRFMSEINEATLLLLLPFFVKANQPDDHWKTRLLMKQNSAKEIIKVTQLLVNAIVNKEEIDERQFMEMMDTTNDPDEQEPGEKKAEAMVQNAELKQEQSIGSEAEDVDTAIWIQNAGLILLHPFLPVLFDRLSVTNEKKQIANRAKALALIHYLLYLEEDYSDAKMVLPKILCGIYHNVPVSIDCKINDEERKECDELLLSVIEYWNALRNTSIKGLLDAFVLRKGKLRLVDNGWRLLVEKRTEDILLDRLPWSIGCIKLPWMTTPVTTEWG